MRTFPWENELAKTGIDIAFRSIAQGTDGHAGREPCAFEAEDCVVLSRDESFHRTGVDSEQCGARQQICPARSPPGARPSLPARLVHGINDAANQHIAEGRQ